MALVPMLLAETGCVTSPPISAPPGACSALIPDSWRQPVADAAPPAEAADDTGRVKAWIAYALGETGQLKIANGRAADALAIIERCEARDKAAVKASRHKVLGIF
jgi:hypothetical protein